MCILFATGKLIFNNEESENSKMETNDNTISEIQDNNISEKSEINYTDFIGTWHNDADHQSYMYIQNVNGNEIKFS